MKKFYSIIILLAICMGASAQEITVRFSGRLNGSEYCRMDSVAITNLTRNWTETVVYPDNIIVLGVTGIDMNTAEVDGLRQNVPNPFNGETNVELVVSQSDGVQMQLLDVFGKVYAEYECKLDVGVHTFVVTATKPQTYILNAIVGDKSYSIRMVNVGGGCSNSIRYSGVSNDIMTKLTIINEFNLGDNMRYIGYATIENETEVSTIVEQTQEETQIVYLHFVHYFKPSVETLSVRNITASSATLRGFVSSNGGTSITEYGFIYGTTEDNLSQNIHNSSLVIGDYSKELTGLSSYSTYYYKAYATNSAGTSYGEVRTFTTAGTQNGHEWIDLGLPSGTLWATCNVGANSPEDYGDYFAWGETWSKRIYNWETYHYCNGSENTLTKYCSDENNGDNGFTDDLTILEGADDAATANWSDSWRMPTYEELNELRTNCIQTWTTINGVYGRVFTGTNGNYIFLPAAGTSNGSVCYNTGSQGYYWSSSLNADNSTRAWLYGFSSSDSYMDNYALRSYGHSVRPVYVQTQD
jgi:hypothetical protein